MLIYIICLFKVYFVLKKHKLSLLLLMCCYGVVYTLWQRFQWRDFQPSATYQVIGDIVSIPQQRKNGAGFVFNVRNLCDQKGCRSMRRRILLRWFGKVPTLAVGQQWQLFIRIPRHAVIRKKLLSQGYAGVGYVYGKNNHLKTKSNRVNLNKIRESIKSQIEIILSSHNSAGLIVALTVGDRGGISDSQWELLRKTGINHLVAISGLHLGLVASFVYFLFGYCAKYCSRALVYYPSPKISAWGAIIAATLYGGLAGFSIPTKRAMIMVICLMLGRIALRQFTSTQGLLLAMGILFLMDPWQLIMPGFLLSYCAVVLIIYVIAGRMGKEPGCLQWLRVQWAMTLGLAPLTLLFFHQVPLLGFLTNLIAIPWVGFVIVPLCLVGAIMSFFCPGLASVLWQCAAVNMDGLWHCLEWFGNKNALFQHQFSHQWECLACGFGVFCCLAPKGFPGRWLGWVWLLPMFV